MKTKITTETVNLPSHWASALINGDTSGMERQEERDISAWLRDNPHYGPCFDCSEETELKIFDGYLTDCSEFTFPVVFTREAGNTEYLVYPVTKFYEPLPWQKAGLSYTATGYGKKIPTSDVVHVDGRKYRVYCTIYSNAGTCWINFQGRRVVIDQ